ncbi:MAG: hypothetical protein LBM93_10680, partial [Oscillospiraceae bacterium]|nr:hypothetical protein [Oscillospiraceae bacterium]
LWKSFPILGTALGIGKGILQIKERHFCEKILLFARRIHDGFIDDEVFQEKLRLLDKNDKQFKKEFELLIITLDRLDKAEKAVWLAEVYKAFLKKKMDSLAFEDLNLIIDRFFMSDKHLLLRIYYWDKDSKTHNDYFLDLKHSYFNAQIIRLETDGLVFQTNMNTIADLEGKKEYELTAYGRALCEILVEGKIINNIPEFAFKNEP